MKTIKIDHTTIIIHGDFVNLTSEEQQQWFQSEYDKGNPILLEIERAVQVCYED
jgi:hypothetical protein